MVDMATLASLSASLADVDLARRARQDALDWHNQDLEFRREERLQHSRAVMWHDQEVLFRNEERAQRLLINQRREIDEKNEQLRSLANVAALIAGFEVVVLVELQLPSDHAVSEALLALWVFFTSLTVCLMMYSVITCTLIMVAILKRFEINQDDETVSYEATGETSAPGSSFNIHLTGVNTTSELGNFALFWASQCDDDWRRAYSTFTWGVNCFIVSLVFMGWVKFYQYLAPGIVNTCVCGLFLIYMIVTHYKWAIFLNATRPAAGPGGGAGSRRGNLNNLSAATTATTTGGNAVNEASFRAQRQADSSA